MVYKEYFLVKGHLMQRMKAFYPDGRYPNGHCLRQLRFRLQRRLAQPWPLS
jgi:hypothetical protein